MEDAAAQRLFIGGVEPDDAGVEQPGDQLLEVERVALGVVHHEVDQLLAKRRVSPDKASFLKGLVTGSTSKDGFADADLVIEAVFEEMSVKQQVFAEVEAVVSPECVLATNTSALSVTEMASELEHPEQPDVVQDYRRRTGEQDVADSDETAAAGSRR